LFNAHLHQDWVLAGFDATALLTAMLLAGLARYCHRKKEG
jgi:hypothetical protein